MVNQKFTVPEKYHQLKKAEVFAKIKQCKEKLQDSTVILGHHYQRDEVYQFADITGDSLRLSQEAAKLNAKYIVFCGVHFMAETADILNDGKKIVTLPDMRAGCPMADMAPIHRVERMWKKITKICGTEIIPITYINSSAALKAFCAERGGTVCTSSNADKIIAWALQQNKKILFLPDKHLGGNVARDAGIPDQEIVTLERKTPESDLKQAKVILWQGHCPVHNKFSKEAVEEARKRVSGIKLIAHPECPREVYELAEHTGSTQKIIQTIKDSEPGSKWVIGTETHLVGRLKKQHPDKHIEILSTPSCMCSMMDRISPEHLLWNLESILEGNPVNQVSVPKEIAAKSKKALELMLELSQ